MFSHSSDLVQIIQQKKKYIYIYTEVVITIFIRVYNDVKQRVVDINVNNPAVWVILVKRS